MLVALMSKSKLYVGVLTPLGLQLVQPSALGILGTSFPPGQAKSWAFATFSAGAPLGGSVGAVFSGV